MTYNYTEKEMVLEYCKILEKKNVTFAVEVPFYNRSIDLVYLDKEGNTCAVEFKLNNWKKAIDQAKDCTTGAHFVYICVPNKNYSLQLKEEVEKAGCGLIIFDPSKKNSSILNECKNENFWSGAHELLKKGFTYSVENNNYKQLMSL